MEPIIIFGAFALIVLVCSLVKPDATRIFLGPFFLVMALGVNLMLVLTAPNFFGEMAREAFIPFYRTFFAGAVAQHPAGYGLAVALFELTVAALIMARGRLAKAGLFGAGVFNLAIAPLGWLYLPNLLLAAAEFFLSTREHPRSMLDLVRGRRRSGPAKDPAA